MHMRSQTSRNIDFYESDRELIVQFRWFTPVAFFLVFFCIAWDSFLVFWYSMAGGGDAPWIFFVFPLAHVAVGVGLTYYTLCLFFNKTFIAADDETLRIRHAPLPWPGNKEIPSSEIVQIYVRENTVQGKNGTRYTYELRCILKNDQDIKLLTEKEMGLASGASKAKLLERKIEDYLKIQDYAVEGEYAADGKLRKGQTRRTSGKDLNPTDITLNDLKKGYVLTYDNTTWETVYRTQYDWIGGETDTLFRLASQRQDSILLYLQSRMGASFVWIERKIDLFQLESAGLTKYEFKNLPSEIDFEGTVYFKKEVYNGKQFVDEVREGIETGQCFFVSQDKTKSLRLVERSARVLTAFAGEQAQEYEFSNILPK